MGRLRKHFFGISPQEATFARRGFAEGAAGAQPHLERIGKTFLLGYHAALNDDRPSELRAQLDAVASALRGFAYEGAAMAMALMDKVMPWRTDRLRMFLDGPGAPHVYMIHVGAGWAWARLGLRVERPMRRLDPLLGWLALDGYGFHEGYFYADRFIREQERPRKLQGYALRAFDQGLGRSLWFVEGAGVVSIAETIAAFPPERRADLWSGVGLACAYAGGVEPRVIEALRELATSYWAELAQGAAFAAEARRRAGNPVLHTEQACTVLCHATAKHAATVTEQALRDLPPDAEVPAYEIWRHRIQTHFSEAQAGVLSPST